MDRIFILSPASTSGARARLLYHPNARFELASRVRHRDGAALGEIFSFLSGLYFRGKLAYARTFARPPRGVPGVLVITSGRGLLPADTPVTLEELQAFAEVPIEPKDPRYLKPLERDAKWLARVIGQCCQTVLLGSIGTKKYGEVLLPFLGERLWFPLDFVGRGDMSRGGLLLRSVAEGRELSYARFAGAVRHGKRPPRLEPKRWGYRILSGRTELTVRS